MRTLAGLQALLPGRLLTEEADLLAYSYDAALERHRPDAVAVARSVSDVQAVVRWCVENKVPYVARGAGTNLSGGCIPLKGGVVLSTAKMDGILAVDTRENFAVVEPGVVNLRLQKELEKAGRFYAPDPASYRVCTLGGNIGENAGGPRCLRYGVTTNHVLGLEAVMPDGSLERFSLSDRGPELVSLLVGAEGTLGIVTKAWLRILPIPERISTALLAFSSLEGAMGCVADIIAAGILPRVLEAMDRLTLQSIESYVAAGYPKAEAVLLTELEGAPSEVEAGFNTVRELAQKRGCTEFRLARSEAEREKLWEGRRSAYAALSQLAPNVLSEDCVVPRSRLAEAAGHMRRIAAEHRLRLGILFHAGDGNLHPNMIYDERDAELTARVKKAGYEMMARCVELGGSISGEHGIGADKRAAMAWLFSSETLELFRRIKRAFDPGELANPDKLFPLAGEKPPGEVRLPEPRPLTMPARELVKRVRALADRKEKVVLLGAGTRVPPEMLKLYPAALSTSELVEIVELDRSDYTAVVEAGISPRKLVDLLEAQRFYTPIPRTEGTMGGLLATRTWAGLRDCVIGMRVLLADGTVVQLGGKVVKNVAGYDVPRLLLGSRGGLGIILEITLKLSPIPYGTPRPVEFARSAFEGPWWDALKRAFDPDRRLNPWLEDYVG